MVYRFRNLFRVIPLHFSTCSKIPINTSNSTMPRNLVLYGDEVSPPVRFIMMAGSILNLDLNFQFVNLFKAENASAEFTKMNPLRKVPVLQTDGEVICDSHAISLYLCDISKNDCLYPNDPLTRARINQMMFFNSGTLFPIDSFLFTKYFEGKWSTELTKIEEWYLALDHLEYQLSKHTWLGTNKPSLADLCCGATVSSMQLLVKTLERHVMVNSWLQKLQELPCYEINTRGLERLKSFLDKDEI